MSYILIVDDEKSIRETFRIFLTSAGYQAESACDVESALVLMETQFPDLVVTDIIMPRISGMEFLAKINSYNRNIPVIVMTGEPTAETAQQSVLHDAIDYLVKPVNKNQLLASVERALAHKKA